MKSPAPRRRSSETQNLSCGESKITEKSKNQKPCKQIEVEVLVNFTDEFDEKLTLKTYQKLVTQNDTEGIDLNAVVKETLNHYKLDPAYGIEVEYWSSYYQTYVSLGVQHAESLNEVHVLVEDELVFDSMRVVT